MDARILALIILLASVILATGCIGAQRAGAGNQNGVHPPPAATQDAGSGLGDQEISPAAAANDAPVLSDEDVIPPSDDAVQPSEGLSGGTAPSGDAVLLTDSDIAVTDIPEGDLISLEDVIEPG